MPSPTPPKATGPKGRSTKLNFGGQNAELWCPGGEIKFLACMVEGCAQPPENWIVRSWSFPLNFPGWERSGIA
ncbi:MULTISPECIES: RlmF-related methyltransferase [unclassified Leisingera]|uniref:RlmF-related methyltransferase n=1 Tax=unclassified Leisingera TaxID=2614906 RepID=UPI0020C7F638|nr:RlmF-related methyltransferase [Leisingera sp. NJS201]